MLSKDVFKTVKRIELSVRGPLDAMMAGAYHSSFKGNGVEFSEVREYVPGDDVRSIDWNVTARMGTPYIKKFVEERELTLMLMVDASSSSEFGSGKEMKGDKVGLLIFTDQVELFIPPAKGKKHVLRLVREILYFKPEHHRTNLQQALEYVGGVLNRRAMVVVMSDFMDAGFETAFKILGKRHDMLAVSVMDPRESELPPVGLVEFEDPETGETMLVDTGDAAFREAFAYEAKKAQKATKNLFQKMNVNYVQCLVHDEFRDTVAPLVEHFRMQQRRRS